MNASRLLEIVQLLEHTEKTKKIQEALNNAYSSLRNLVSQPSHPSYQSDFAASLDILRALMGEVHEGFQPAQIKLLEEIGAAEFFTDDLASEIERWVMQNVATPAVAQEKLSTLISERDTYITEITQLQQNLVRMGIEVSGLEAGQAEIGFLLPRELFNNHLEDLIKELDVLKRVIRAFSEAATGSAEPIEVRQISTTDPLFFFGLPPAVIAVLGAAVTWALNTWKQVEEIREIRARTAKISAFEGGEIEKMFDETIKSHVEQAIAAHTAEIVGAINGDNHRKNEQELHIRWALDSIISRVERGMIVEIRLLPPALQEDSEGEDQPDTTPVFKDLKAIAAQLVFPKMEGEPVLQIPPVEPDTKKRPSTR